MEAERRGREVNLRRRRRKRKGRKRRERSEVNLTHPPDSRLPPLPAFLTPW